MPRDLTTARDPTTSDRGIRSIGYFLYQIYLGHKHYNSGSLALETSLIKASIRSLTHRPADALLA